MSPLFPTPPAPSAASELSGSPAPPADPAAPAAAALDDEQHLALLCLWRLAGGDWRPLHALTGLPALPRLADLQRPPADWPKSLRQLLARTPLQATAGRAALAAAASDLRWLQRHGAWAVRPGRPPLGPHLQQIADPPALLWGRGTLPASGRAWVAMVGSRRATRHGLDLARGLAGELAAAGVVVVSGLAHGIDAAAHAGALAAGGPSVAVLGGGLGRLYPVRHTGLAAELCQHGAVLSEFPPRLPALAHHFPMRNRLISGLCLGVVVVEAALRSGSLVTARLAREQDRELMVVPGAVGNPVAAGGHQLLREGAALVTSAADVLDALGVAAPAQSAAAPLPALARLLAGGAMTVDALAAASGMPVPEVLAALTDLEVAGIVAAGHRGYSLRPQFSSPAGRPP